MLLLRWGLPRRFGTDASMLLGSSLAAWISISSALVFPASASVLLASTASEVLSSSMLSPFKIQSSCMTESSSLTRPVTVILTWPGVHSTQSRKRWSSGISASLKSLCTTRWSGVSGAQYPSRGCSSTIFSNSR